MQSLSATAAAGHAGASPPRQGTGGGGEGITMAAGCGGLWGRGAQPHEAGNGDPWPCLRTARERWGRTCWDRGWAGGEGLFTVSCPPPVLQRSPEGRGVLGAGGSKTHAGPAPVQRRLSPQCGRRRTELPNPRHSPQPESSSPRQTVTKIQCQSVRGARRRRGPGMGGSAWWCPVRRGAVPVGP